MKISLGRMLIVAALGGLCAGGAKLCSIPALQPYADYIAIAIFVLAPVLNKLEAAWSVHDTQPPPLPLPPAEDR